MLRRRSSQSKKGGHERRASIKNTLAANDVINTASAAGADDPNLVSSGSNPLYNDGVGGEAKHDAGAEAQQKSVCACVSILEASRQPVYFSLPCRRACWTDHRTDGTTTTAVSNVYIRGLARWYMNVITYACHCIYDIF